MASVTDRIHSALLELSQQPWGDDSSIYSHLKDFEDGIQFLSRFVDCIRNWSDALELAPHLGSLATEIEASVQKIGAEFIEEFNRDKWASVFTVVSFNLLGSFEKRASKWIEFFEESEAMIDVLKPEIAEACDRVSVINSVKCNSPMLDFNKWKKFVKSTNFQLRYAKGNFDAHCRRHSRSNIRLVEGPSFFEVILGSLAYDNLKNPKIEAFLVSVGSSTISAAMLSCQFWAKNFDQNVKEDVDAAFRDLEQKVGLTNPDFIDIILGELKASEKSSSIVKIVVNRLIPFMEGCQGLLRKEYLIFAKLGSELKYLVTTVLNMPEEDALLQIFLPDIKQLVMEIASRHRSLFHGKDRSVAMDLLGKACLIKVEIFLRAQLAAYNVLTLKEHIDALNQVVSVMEVVVSPERIESAKFANQILLLLKEVAIDVQRYQQSSFWALLKYPLYKGINKETVRLRLLLKTLLLKGELLFLKLHDKLLPSFKDRITALHEGFKIMIPLAIKDGKLNFSDVEIVASRIISLYHLILSPDISEEMLQCMNRSVSDLVDELKFVMKEFKEIYLGEIYLRVRNSDFPKTNAAGFIDSLLRKLQDCLAMEWI